MFFCDNFSFLSNLYPRIEWTTIVGDNILVFIRRQTYIFLKKMYSSYDNNRCLHLRWNKNCHKLHTIPYPNRPSSCFDKSKYPEKENQSNIIFHKRRHFEHNPIELIGLRQSLIGMISVPFVCFEPVQSQTIVRDAFEVTSTSCSRTKRRSLLFIKVLLDNLGLFSYQRPATAR